MGAGFVKSNTHDEMQVSNFLLVLLPSGPPLANADVASNATLAATQQAAPKLLYDFNCQAEELAMLATTIVTSRMKSRVPPFGTTE